MTENELHEQYFSWMYRLVHDSRYTKRLSYRKLLRLLDNTRFTYSLELDDNRASDGIDLRYRFGMEKSYPCQAIASLLDVRDCSVLEMMVALSLRCEEHIMCDSNYGNRTGEWFWGMINNMHLMSMCDSRFDMEYSKKAVDTMLDRSYCANGDGGLFTVRHSNRDLRDVEIWYQMCWYLNEVE